MPVPFCFRKRRPLPRLLSWPAFWAAFPLLCLLAGPAGIARAEAPLPVVASIAPQKYMLERIAGGSVAVTVLVRPGADPHSYEPSPAQMRACAGARVWFTIGVPFEDVWLPRIQSAAPNLAVFSTISRIKRLRFADDALLLEDLRLSRQAGEKAAAAPGQTPPAGQYPDAKHESRADADDHAHDRQADAAGHERQTDAAGYEHSHGHGDGHDHGHAHGDEAEDPHVWLSPMLVRDMLPDMARELGRLVPGRAAEFRANAKAFAAELEALDETLANRFADVPRNKRVFLTFHPSWRYFAHNYGLTELAIEVEGKEPGPQSMKEIINTAKAYGIRTIFVEPQFPRAAAGAIAANIGARVVTVDPLAEDLPAAYTDLADKLMESFTPGK